MEATFEIPGDPVPQPRPRFTRHGRSYPHDNGIFAYKALIRAMSAAAGGTEPVDGPFEIELVFVIGRPPSHFRRDGSLAPKASAYPSRRSGDWDNLAKGVCDAITDSKAIWIDDDQVVDARVRRRYAVDGESPRTVVSVRRLPP
jgi:Holliday junction resolvase RusA-like endonuclease